MNIMSNITKSLVFFSLLIGLGYIALIGTAHAGHEEHAIPQTFADNSQSSTPSEAAYDNDWSCPMHPQIHQHEPGKCPICKMKLIKPKRE